MILHLTPRARGGIRRAAWLLLTLAMCLSSTQPTYALTQRDLFALGINYFDIADRCAPVATDTVAGTDTTAQQIASTFIVGFSASTPKDVITNIAKKYHIGGMYLIGTKDAASAGFDKAFYDQLNTAAGKKMIIASDEEGGSVNRYAYPSGSFPSPTTMGGQSNDAVKAIGQKAGAVMASNGITTDLAPILDLRSVGVAGRNFSSNPDVVADKAGAFAEGLKASGIKPVFKHFPGFDSTTSGNTDETKVVMTGSIDKTVEPYRKLVAERTDAGVMLSNMYVNALDQNYPSSLSTATVQYLRTNIKFTGLITTDDLGVKSVTDKAGSLAAAVSGSLQAGVTMPLFTLKAGSQTEAETNMDTIIASVQGNSAAMSAVTSTQSVIQMFKGEGATLPPTNTGPAAAGCCNTQTSTVVGDTNEAKIWNYFIKAGIGAIAAAGILGNMSQESGLNPAREQSKGAWEDMSDKYYGRGGRGGVGLVQWDGPRRPAAITYLLGHGLTQAELHQATDKLLVAELDYITQVEFTGGYKSALTNMQAAPDAATAAYIFHRDYERSSDGPSAIKERTDDATKFYQKYTGGGSADTPESTNASRFADASMNSGACSQNQSPECPTATGPALILCEAKKYDPVSYVWAGAHDGAAKWIYECTHSRDSKGRIDPTETKPIDASCGLDCSGLVNVAVYDAFKIDLRENTDSERTSKHWVRISSLKDVQPGDIMQPHAGHVEIVDHIEGNTIHTFGAHTANRAQPDQVGPSKSTYNSNMLFLRLKEATSPL